jgi:type VII secretion integral membrane protein EccD
VSVCRLTFQIERGVDGDTVDVAVPMGTPLCGLLPAIVSLVPSSPEPDTVVDDWRLQRACGTPIDDSKTLAENGIRDGDLIIVTTRSAPALDPVQWDPCRTIAVADAPTGNAHPVAAAVCVWTAIAASVALAWTGAGAREWNHLIVAASAACAAAVAAVANGSSTSLRVAAVCLSVATGFLAVPSAPSAANAFLAASAGLSMSLLMLRSVGRTPAHLPATTTMAATATLSALLAVATAAPVIATVSASAAGAMLATASLGLLAVAPRVAIIASKLQPGEHPDDCDTRASLAHAILTGLVVGCACAAAIGALAVALGCRRSDSPTLACVAFTAVVGLVLSLRSRTHVDGLRRSAVSASGLICLTASFAIVVGTAPAHVGWTSAVAVSVGLCAVRVRGVGPGLTRAVELLDYAALAAVPPLACWVGGVYSIARQAHLL